MKSNHLLYILFPIVLFCMLIAACGSDAPLDSEALDVSDKALSGGRPQFSTRRAMRFQSPHRTFPRMGWKNISRATRSLKLFLSPFRQKSIRGSVPCTTTSRASTVMRETVAGVRRLQVKSLPQCFSASVSPIQMDTGRKPPCRCPVSGRNSITAPSSVSPQKARCASTTPKVKSRQVMELSYISARQTTRWLTRINRCRATLNSRPASHPLCSA